MLQRIHTEQEPEMLDAGNMSLHLENRQIEIGTFDPSPLSLIHLRENFPFLMDFPAHVFWMGPDPDLNKRNIYEHVHTEDEILFCAEGKLLLFLNDREDLPPLILSIGVGYWFRIPRRIKHGFRLDPVTPWRALRFFSDPTGWMPYFTQSGIEATLDQIILP